MSKKFLFITTLNLFTNPRLVKEINLALSNGYSAELICFEFDNWSKELNKNLINNFTNVNVITIPAGRKPFFYWFQSVFTECIYRLFGNIVLLSTPFLSQAVSRRSNLLIKALCTVSKPDWVIGHNPGALWPSIVAFKMFKCKIGFDVEDYHPGEGDDLYLQKLTKQLLIRILPKMNYVSFASPLIKQAVKRDFKSDISNSVTILNYFPADGFQSPPILVSGPVKLVWFSQNIDKGRGLEYILPLVNQKESIIELHLIGNLNEAFFESTLSKINNVFIHGAMSQKLLHQQLGDFDIGLALEPAKDENNDLAISNKMLAYLQAGLFVVASNTTAQESYLNELPNHGICFDYIINDLGIVLDKLIADIDTIRVNRVIRFTDFKNKNWENESLRLLEEWNR